MQTPAAEIKPRKSASHGEAGYPRAAFDAYFTPPWCTRLLCQEINFHLDPDGLTKIWEPACGNGQMVEELRRAGYYVEATDLADHGFGEAGVDFLTTRPTETYSAIVTNPPFGTLARQFVVRALEMTQPQRGKVAILQRHEFDAPKTNWPIFRYPYAMKLILPRRPKWSAEDKASPRFPFAWYLWDWRWVGEPVTRFLDDSPKTQQDLL